MGAIKREGVLKGFLHAEVKYGFQSPQDASTSPSGVVATSSKERAWHTSTIVYYGVHYLLSGLFPGEFDMARRRITYTGHLFFGKE